jgi:hypothetical protein
VRDWRRYITALDKVGQVCKFFAFIVPYLINLVNALKQSVDVMSENLAASMRDRIQLGMNRGDIAMQ